MSLGAAPSMSLIDSSSGVMGMGMGNYKGVMLCNRPFGGTSSGYIIYFC
jgi:hypothetical protein